MTLGPRPTIRCEKAPTVVATERAKPHGKMSMCEEHLAVFKALGGSATFRKILRYVRTEGRPLR